MGYMSEYQLDRWRYMELRAICRQYDQLRWRARCLLEASCGTDGPRGNLPGDPVARVVSARERIMKQLDAIEKAATTAGAGQWRDVLIDNACHGKAYDDLDKTRMPTSKRKSFFRVRREFFYLLSSYLDG